MNECPTPKELDENLYKGFLLLSEEEKNYDNFCVRYQVMLDNKIIGYADIKNPKKEDLNDLGNIGIIILKEYINQGIGLITLKMLLKKAKNEFNLTNITISTSNDNVSIKQIYKKISEEEGIHIHIR